MSVSTNHSRCLGSRRGAATMALLCLASLAPLTGCQSLFFLAHSERKKQVAAECDKLRGQRVAIVVWAEQGTLDLDPYAQQRTANLIGIHLNPARAKELKGTTLIDEHAVAKLQEQLGTSGPLASDQEILRKLAADMLLRVDLFEYTTRAPEAPGLKKARISGNISVHRAGDAQPIYRTEVSASYPEDSNIGVLDKSDEEVLSEALRAFGERVARKFYAHEEEYK